MKREIRLAPASAGVRIEVRRALRSDETAIEFFVDTVLRRDYFLRRGQLADILSGKYHEVFVAELDGVLVGIAITTSGARLINALVHPAYRGLSIGRALVEESGVREVRAKTDVSTGDPRGFYQALGFESTGIRNAKGNIELMRRPESGTASERRKRAVS